MTKTVVFIHGLFQNPDSWAGWIAYYQAQGFSCYAPAYPYHEGPPAELRQTINPALGHLTLQEVVDVYARLIDQLPAAPILIGHSMGGLVVQKLIAMKKGVAGVCIDTAPPRGVLSFKWSFLKSNLATVNPLKGNSAFLPSVEWFHYAFCNTMTMAETKREYDRYVVPESRNIARTSTGPQGKIDFTQPHAPLLFIAGADDHIVPPTLNFKNYQAYPEDTGIREYIQLPNRSHYICGQSGWEEVAQYAIDWLASLK